MRWLLFFFALTPAVVHAQEFEFSISDTTVFYDVDTGAGTAFVSISVEQTDLPIVPTRSPEFCISYDDEFLTPVAVTYNEDFVRPSQSIELLDLDPGPGIYVGVGFGIGNQYEIVERVEVFVIEFQLVEDSFSATEIEVEAVVEFVDGLGTPGFSNQIGYTLPAPGGVADPAFSPGTVQILPAPEFKRGDADGDSVVMPITDALYILDFAFLDGPPPPCEDAADVDDDGVCELVLEAVYLLSWGFSDGPDPAAPFPDCGADEDDLADGMGCDGADCE